VNHVAGGIIRAVEMLSFELRREENGTATDVDLRDSGLLEKKLRDAQIQIKELKRRNKALEEQLLLTGNKKDVGKGGTMTLMPVGEKCLVLGDSMCGYGCVCVCMCVFW